jgi:hypothetical protein
MRRQDIETLGKYNAEKARGIVHTIEWVAEMNRLQSIFDKPRCTCGDTYEVGSGKRCPIHEQ